MTEAARGLSTGFPSPEKSSWHSRKLLSGWGHSKDSLLCRGAARVPRARTAAHTCSLLLRPSQNLLLISAFLLYLWPWDYRQTARSHSGNYTFPCCGLLPHKHPSAASRQSGAWTIADDSAQPHSTASSYHVWVQVALLAPKRVHHERWWGLHQQVSFKTKKRKESTSYISAILKTSIKLTE